MTDKDEALAQPQQETCGYDETTGLCTRNPCCYTATEEKQETKPACSFMTREQAVAFCRRIRPAIEPTEQHVAATIDAYSALFGDLAPAQLPQQEPVAWWHQKSDTFTSGSLVSNFVEWVPLYTSPPAQPLTDEEYTALAHRIASKYAHRSDPSYVAYTFLPHTLEQFVRAIEAAHGIKGDA